MKPSNKRRICSAFFSILCNLRPLMMKIIKKKKNILRALICVFDIHFLPRFAFRQSFLSIVFTPCTLSIESMRSYFHQQTWQLEYAMCLGNTHADNWFSRVWVLIKKQKSKWTHSHSTYLSSKFVCFFLFCQSCLVSSNTIFLIRNQHRKNHQLKVESNISTIVDYTFFCICIHRARQCIHKSWMPITINIKPMTDVEEGQTIDVHRRLASSFYCKYQGNQSYVRHERQIDFHPELKLEFHYSDRYCAPVIIITIGNLCDCWYS